ncbi:hypothetical protein OUZ56_021895 [Daphnia magna]|uniref:Uncharacterized protein n=1 Tax=Daphnia magna TaxID=35525 RepID=A0ABR0AUS1_9CRUS|nr:hypothetical protein OUZ56_021895 [Daphnia magna]
MEAREVTLIEALQKDESLTKRVMIESAKGMTKIKEDLLNELRRARQTEQRETTVMVGDSAEEGMTGRNRHSSNASATTSSCETRDELIAERHTSMTELMGAALVVKTSLDKPRERRNKRNNTEAGRNFDDQRKNKRPRAIRYSAVRDVGVGLVGGITDTSGVCADDYDTGQPPSATSSDV